MKWSVVSNKLLYGGFFKLYRFELRHDLFDGGESPVLTRELLDRYHAAAVLPYDPVRDELVLIEQFRSLIEPGETAEQLVHREAMEEAGCIISDVIPVHHYYSSPGSSNEKIQIYFARTETEGLGGVHGIDEEGEDIRVHVVSSDTALEWLDQGRIDSALPIIALQWFRLNRDRIRKEWLETP
jgi:ADP-ribose pyrophosphatase